MATTNTNFKVKNGLDAGGNLTTTAGLQVGTTATVNGNFTTYGTSTLHANQQLSLAVRNGANYTGNILQYSLNDSTVTGGVTARGLIFAGSTGFENNQTYNLSATNPYLTSSTATFTVSTIQTYNPFAAGQKIIVSGASQAQYNGSWVTTAVGGSSGAWTVTIVAPGTTTPFTNGGALTATGTIAVEPAGFFKQPSPGAVGLVIKGAGTSGSATDPFRYVDSAGNTKTYITAAGDITAPAISAIWSITSSAQDVTVNALRARHSVANYRANLQTWENASTVLAGVNAQGQFFTGGTTPIQGSTTVAINTHTPTGTTDISVTTASNHGISVGQTVVVAGITPAGYNGTWVARAGTTGTTLVLPIGSNPGAITVAGTVTQNSQVGITAISAYNTPLVVRAAGSHQANIFEAQRSAPDTVFRIRNNGQFGSGSLLTGTNAWINNDILGNTIGLTIRGAAAQSSDLLQIQDSTSATLAKIDSVGAFTTNSANGYSIAGAAAFKSLNLGQTMLLTAGSSVSANPHVVVRQSSGATGNIMEWQNSAGTVLSRIDSGGNIVAPNTTGAVSSGTFILGSRNSGGELTLVRETAATSNPGANLARIYFRDGTTAGTLKFATRTGASGVEETIVDNISSTGSTAGAQFVGAGGVNTTGTLTSTGLILSGTTSPITLNGSVGTSGQVLTSGGAGATPTWTTVSGGSFTGGTLTSDLVLAAGSTTVEPLTFQSNSSTPTTTSGAMDYDGTVFYSTSNTNPGRGLNTQNYYYADSSTWSPDFTLSTTAQSFLGAATRGITLAAGTSYEFEFQARTRFQVINVGTAASGSYSLIKDSGTATIAIQSLLEYGSNTTNHTTATTLSALSNTGTDVTFSPSVSSGSRFAFIRAKGIIRVTGTGTAKIYPALTPSALMTNNDPNFTSWQISNVIFKLTPIGNGTVTQVGTWS